MIKKQVLIDVLKKMDKEFFSGVEESSNFDLSKYSKQNFPLEKKAILGLDIYKYSDYEENRQNLIPFVLDLLLDAAIDISSKMEPVLFSEVTAKMIRNNFISTGDGGFIIFETPLHALIFNFIFYAALHLFNTGHSFPKLSKYIEDIFIRSSITYDNIYCYEENYYGKAIINNARILSKDKLNRFIVDKNTFDYFNKYYNGIESISIINKKTIKSNLKIEKEFNTFFFNGSMSSVSAPVKNIHIQKLDEILSKNTKLVVYNIEVQLCIAIVKSNLDQPEEPIEFIYTIGNTNINNLL